MKREYTAPEFENLDLRSPVMMDIVGSTGGIDWGDNNASAGDNDPDFEDE